MPHNRIKMMMIVVIVTMTFTGSLAWGWASVVFGDFNTHGDTTQDVILEAFNVNGFPDLHRFILPLENGANTESHDIPDGSPTEWWKPEDASTDNKGIDETIWYTASEFTTGETNSDTDYRREGALSLYKKGEFSTAYLAIGYELHLLQDTTSPPHIKYNFHGDSPYFVDDLEYWAGMNHGYATTSTPWYGTYTIGALLGTEEFQFTFPFWLSDQEDDDNRNEAADALDEVDASGALIVDGPSAFGVPSTSWGTYGVPASYEWEYGYPVFPEQLPGQNEGLDWYGSTSGYAIAHEQLQQAYMLTQNRLLERSTGLPPVILGEDSVDSLRSMRPAFSVDSFGPKQETEIRFAVYENRHADVRLKIQVDGKSIKDEDGTVYNGDDDSKKTLLSDDRAGTLPYATYFRIKWTGELENDELEDGEHTLEITAIDFDNNESETRELKFYFDKTPPKVTRLGIGNTSDEE